MHSAFTDSEFRIDKARVAKAKSNQVSLRVVKGSSKSDGSNIDAHTDAQGSSQVLFTGDPKTDAEIADAELAARLFQEEHGEEVTIADIQAEEKSLQEEHQKALISGKVKKMEKPPRPVLKGIVIKENVGADETLLISRKPTDDAKLKQKGIMVEEGKGSKKVNTTSVAKQVVQNPLSTQMQLSFVKPTIAEQTLVTGGTNVLQNRASMAKQPRDTSGLGSHREKMVNSSPLDPSSLSVPGLGVPQENLEKLESVQLIHQKSLDKDFLLYFMADGTLYKIGEHDIDLKLSEELEYVLYLFKVKNHRTQQAANVLRNKMLKAKALSGTKYSSDYVPKYRDYHGKIVEMQRNCAKLKTDFGITVLEFNPESEKAHFIRLGNDMRRNKIYALRSAIYQTNEDDPELKELRQIMQELEKAERRLLIDYLRSTPDVEEIK